MSGRGARRRQPAWHRFAPLAAVAAVGTAMAVASVGFVATSTERIERAFADQPTLVVVDDLGTGLAGAPLSFPPDAGAQIEALGGVTAAGVSWSVRGPNAPALVSRARKGQPAAVAVTAAQPSALAAEQVRVASGRLYDVGHEQRAEKVAVLGAGAAQRLGLGDLASTPAVYLDGVGYAVLGILDPASGPPDLGDSVVIPASTALAAYGPPQQPRARLVADVRGSYAPAVAAQAATILNPEEPDRFSVHRMPAPVEVRAATLLQLRRLLWVIAGLTLLLAAGLVVLTVPRLVRGVGPLGGGFAFRAAGAALLGSLLATNVVVAALWLGTRDGQPVVLPRGLVVVAALVPAVVALLLVLRAARRRPRPRPQAVSVSDLLS